MLRKIKSMEIERDNWKVPNEIVIWRENFPCCSESDKSWDSFSCSSWTLISSTILKLLLQRPNWPYLLFRRASALGLHYDPVSDLGVRFQFSKLWCRIFRAWKHHLQHHLPPIDMPYMIRDFSLVEQGLDQKGQTLFLSGLCTLWHHPCILGRTNLSSKEHPFSFMVFT